MHAVATEVSVSVIAGFSSDGRVYRFHGHLLAAHPGELLLVPLGRSTGDLRAVVDHCPLPWAEVFATLDAPFAAAQPVPPEAMCHDHPRLAHITPYGWITDDIAVGPGRRNVQRLAHPSGILFARAMP